MRRKCRDPGDVHIEVNEKAWENNLWDELPANVSVTYNDDRREITIRFEDGEDR